MTVKYSEEDLDRSLSERYTPEMHRRIRDAKVGIAGLGGLGSNIAAMLVRAGVRDIVIADHDTVDLGNINRQNYRLDQIGTGKTDATEQTLMGIDPYVRITKHSVRLDRDNIPGIFEDREIICEAFDVPEEKAMLINTVLEMLPSARIVSGSGMAGFGRSNDIVTRRVFDRLWICGDGVDMEDVEGGLMSPRVNICAGHMANAVIEMITEGQ